VYVRPRRVCLHAKTPHEFLAAQLLYVWMRADLGVHEEMVVFTSFLVFLASWVVVGVAFPVRGSDMLFGT